MSSDYEAEYKCVKCGDNIDSLEALQRHLSVDHMRWVPYECLYCDMFKATETELRDHVTQRHPDKPVKLVVSSDAANQQRLRTLIDQSTRRKSAHRAATTPVEMCGGGVPEEYFSTPRHGRSTERESQPVSVKVEFVDLSTEEAEPPIKLSPHHTSEYAGATNERPANESVENETGGIDNTPAAKSYNLRRLVQSRLGSRQSVSGSQRPAEGLGLDNLDTPDGRYRKRRLHYQGFDTSHCRLCNIDKNKFDCKPVLHVYRKHMAEKAVFCKYCGVGERYELHRIRAHIRLRHPQNDVESGIVDKRQQLEPLVRAWMQRCYGGGADNDEKEEESDEPQSAVKTRRLSTESSVSNSRHCFVCKETFSDNPSQHVYAKHMKANVWHCKLCDYDTARRDSLIRHLRGRHPADDAATNIDDRREQYRQEFEDWHKRCFDETMADSSTAASPALDQLLPEAPGVRADAPEGKERQSDQDERRQSETNSVEQRPLCSASKSRRILEAVPRRSSGVPKRRQALCRLCNLVVTVDKRHAQIWHLKETLYECLGCGTKSNASSAAVRQLHRAKGCTSEVTDHSAKYLDSLSELYESCFG